MKGMEDPSNMNLLSNEMLRRLIAEQSRPSVSIYMPTIRAGDESPQNAIRFKNLVNEAEERLVEAGYRRPEVKALLGPAYELLANEHFWQKQSEGFAFFVSSSTTRYYRLPLSFSEGIFTGDTFYVKPLLPLITNNGRFFILALSQQAVRLFEGTRDTIDEIDMEDAPGSLAEALKWDDPEPQLQHHEKTGPSTFGAKQGGFHGHGVGHDDQKTDILRFFQKVDKALREILAGEEAPLILAGVEYLHPIYREASGYAHILEQGIPGNPDESAARELHQQALEIVEPLFRQEQERSAGRYHQHAGSEHASEDIAGIVQAAVYGQISDLFVATDSIQWGQFDPETGQVTLHESATPESTDLVDLAACHTYLNGGRVFAVPAEEVPASGPVAAVLRWPEAQ
jgi:hypothetical protein